MRKGLPLFYMYQEGSMLIETLKSGNSFTGNYILKQPEIRVSQKGNKYFTGYLQDKSGKLEFKL